MKKNEESARSMSPEGQWILRQMIVKLHLKGLDAKTIADIIPYGKLRHVQSTIKKYKQGGWDAIAPKKMGRPRNSNKTLNPEQEVKIRETLIWKTSEEWLFRYLRSWLICLYSSNVFHLCLMQRIDFQLHVFLIPYTIGSALHHSYLRIRPF